MKYKEAFAIATEIEGVIKCSWVKLYDANDNPVYSLQKIEKKQLAINEGRQGSVNEHDRIDLYTNTWNSYTEGVVTANKYIYAYKVPVKLSPVVISLFKHELEKIETDIKWYKDNNKTGYFKYGQILHNKKRYLDLINGRIQLYVKPKALEWYPLNTANIYADLDAKKAAVEKAKKLLALSAATIIV